jgi:cytochrome c551/c552
MKLNSIILSAVFISVLVFCGFDAANFQEKPDLKDKGIGTVKTVKVGAIDKKLADKGSNIFDTKCLPCHNIDNVNLAPALRGAAKKLSPEFIMNYVMNTAEMQKKNPYVKSLILQWKKVPIMKNQKLSEKDARAVLEFLRTQE